MCRLKKTGIGGFTMLMQELATAVYYNFPVKVVIFKNNAFMIERFEQEETGAEEYGIELSPIDSKKVAGACGAEGYHCSDPNQLEDVLREAFTSEKSSLIEVDVDPDYPPVRPEDMKA